MTKVNYKKYSIALLSCFVGLTGSVAAQKISESLCNTIFDSVHAQMKPTKIYRKDIFTSDCKFEFDVDKKTGASLSIEQFADDIASRKSFSESSMDAAGRPRKPTNVADLYSDERWDEAALFLSKRKFDSFLLLRKKRFVIQIFSDDRRMLMELESILQMVDFN